MRIIAGKAGRIAIKVPSAVARPTTDYVRQAIFNILGETVADTRVLDLFCGSGSLGLEALSRGADLLRIRRRASPGHLRDRGKPEKSPTRRGPHRQKRSSRLSETGPWQLPISSLPIPLTGRATALRIT